MSIHGLDDGEYFVLPKWLSKKIPKHLRLTFIELCLYRNARTGQCFPSIDTLRDGSGLSRKKLCTDLAELEELGYIWKQKRRLGDRQASNLYYIPFDEFSAQSVKKDVQSVISDDPECTQATQLALDPECTQATLTKELLLTKELEQKKEQAPSAEDEKFSTLWTLWPRLSQDEKYGLRVRKDVCAKRWKQAVSAHSPESLILAAKKYLATSGQYTQALPKWLDGTFEAFLPTEVDQAKEEQRNARRIEREAALEQEKLEARASREARGRVDKPLSDW